MPILVADGALHSLISLLHLPDTDVETAAAELIAKLAQVRSHAISRASSRASSRELPQRNVTSACALLRV